MHSYLVSYTQFDSKWIIDLNLKVETFYKETEEKFLEGNRGALCDLWLVNDFLTVTPKMQSKKTKSINQASLKLKKKPHREKMFAKYVPEKDLQPENIKTLKTQQENK